MIKRKSIQFEPEARIIVISDIHGSKDVLQKLLEKVNYKHGKDYLILLGDYAQKGKSPLATLRYIIQLTEYPKVYCLLGNCDHGNFKILDSTYLNKEFKEFLNKPSTLLYDMFEEYKRKNPTYPPLSLLNLQIELKKYFKKELDWLMNLPHMIESEDFIFVHAGLEKVRNYHQSSFKSIIMKRYFYYQGHLADKMVICGHLPVTIYNKHEFDDDILIDLDRKIISIDGGMVVKAGGQLNALIIKKRGSNYDYQKEYEWILPKCKVIQESKEEIHGKGACWPYFKVTILEKGEFFSKVLLEEPQEITLVKNEYLIEHEKKVYDDCPASIIEVPKGEIVGIVNDKCKGYVLVKYKTKQGWIEKNKIGDVIYED